MNAVTVEIKNRWTGDVIFMASVDAALSPGERIGAAVKEALAAKVSLHDADLRYADLRYVDMHGADMHDADLHGADMRDTDLRYADLRYADLRYADMHGANMRGANMRGAKNIPDFRMPDGMLFSTYKRDVVPALLTAGGKTMDEIRASGCWDCHTWTNCPMHVAFGISSPEEGPILLRSRIKEFVDLFDAGLIPAPWGDCS